MSISSSIRLFSLDEIKEATNNFDQENYITGDYDGEVYRAKIYDGKSANSKTEKVCVAVKRLGKRISSEELENEVEIATKIQHPNLASLLGFCVEMDEKALVYENLENGCLDDYINMDSGICLSWKKRLNICLGAAYGLQHLHKETPQFPKGIIHLNVKPSNILLNENWVAKVSGYGLSRSGWADDFTPYSLVDASSYCAPEYSMKQVLTRKADVYAFGMALCQVLCAKVPWDREEASFHPEKYKEFRAWAQKNVNAEKDDCISDDSLKAFTVCIWNCLKIDINKRATMDQVVLDLVTAIKCQGGDSEPVLNIDLKAPRKMEVTQSGSSSSSSDDFLSLSSCSCRQFALGVIKEATDNFNEEKLLGQGGEAKVYLAEIHVNNMIEKTQVAVKQLNKNSTEFVKEILIVTKIQHHNVVSLLGYCNESDEKILIYEYMANGCLSDYVNMDSPISLSWMQRLEICLGAAYGLQHLHKETDQFRKGIIHRDVKPANILLDQNWAAKVSDFGMFKASEATQIKSTIITNRVMGTRGYFAPEYLYSNKVSRKIDVYAFGMVMFDVLCRKRLWDHGDLSYYPEEQNEDIALWAKENVDFKIKHEISTISLMVFTDIIGASVQADPHQRPTMDAVVQKLENALGYQKSYELSRIRAW